MEPERSCPSLKVRPDDDDDDEEEEEEGSPLLLPVRAPLSHCFHEEDGDGFLSARAFDSAFLSALTLPDEDCGGGDDDDDEEEEEGEEEQAAFQLATFLPPPPCHAKCFPNSFFTGTPVAKPSNDDDDDHHSYSPDEEYDDDDDESFGSDFVPEHWASFVRAMPIAKPTQEEEEEEGFFYGGSSGASSCVAENVQTLSAVVESDCVSGAQVKLGDAVDSPAQLLTLGSQLGNDGLQFQPTREISLTTEAILDSVNFIVLDTADRASTSKHVGSDGKLDDLNNKDEEDTVAHEQSTESLELRKEEELPVLKPAQPYAYREIRPTEANNLDSENWIISNNTEMVSTSRYEGNGGTLHDHNYEDEEDTIAHEQLVKTLELSNEEEPPVLKPSQPYSTHRETGLLEANLDSDNFIVFDNTEMASAPKLKGNDGNLDALSSEDGEDIPAREQLVATCELSNEEGPSVLKPAQPYSIHREIGSTEANLNSANPIVSDNTQMTSTPKCKGGNQKHGDVNSEDEEDIPAHEQLIGTCELSNEEGTPVLKPAQPSTHREIRLTEAELNSVNSIVSDNTEMTSIPKCKGSDQKLDDLNSEDEEGISVHKCLDDTFERSNGKESPALKTFQPSSTHREIRLTEGSLDSRNFVDSDNTEADGKIDSLSSKDEEDIIPHKLSVEPIELSNEEESPVSSPSQTSTDREIRLTEANLDSGNFIVLDDSKMSSTPMCIGSDRNLDDLNREDEEDIEEDIIAHEQLVETSELSNEEEPQVLKPVQPSSNREIRLMEVNLDSENSGVTDYTEMASATHIRQVAVSQPSASLEQSDETKHKLQRLRVKFLHLVEHLGQPANNAVVAQVMNRLGLLERLVAARHGSTSERAHLVAESGGHEDDLDFSCTIMLIGKTGVGKSATINSIFDEEKAETDAFCVSTSKVKETIGNMYGVKLRLIDTPGLISSNADQRYNKKVMASIKRYVKKSCPDIVLYVDRLDMYSKGDCGDLELLRTITNALGASIWLNAIIVLTHASSLPPDSFDGVPISYEMFVGQRSLEVQKSIRQASGDVRLMNPISIVENHVACGRSRDGQRLLPNGQAWKPHLLLLSFASRILAEAASILKLQDRSRRITPLPLPFLLSSLLRSQPRTMPPVEQGGDDDNEDEDGFDEDAKDPDLDDNLPPFRRLKREELVLLNKYQKKAYFEELEYRETLFQKKQWREELRRRRERKKRLSASENSNHLPEEFIEEDAKLPMPDMSLPPSFDSDNPVHRYWDDTSSRWSARPVLESGLGWDHDLGYDGLSMEKMLIVFHRIPASISGRITKDKKNANIQMLCLAFFKHSEGRVTLCGLDLHTLGKDIAYTVQSETKLSTFRHNKTSAGGSITFLGENVMVGMKIEDKLVVRRGLKLLLNGGVTTGHGESAYGGSLEVALRDKDYPISKNISTLGISIMDWRNNLAISGNVLSQFMLGKTTITARVDLNNRGAGQISLRASSYEQLQLALIGIAPILPTIFNRCFSNS